MKRLLHLTLLIALLVLTGCSASNLDFSLNPPATEDEAIVSANETLERQPVRASIPISIGVDSFIDYRPQKRAEDSKKWMGFIPGVFWLEMDSDIPEFYTPFSSFESERLTLSSARAVYNYLKESGHYDKVTYLPIDPYDKVDYRLEGILYRTLVKETGYYYGSSIYAWITRIIGLPYVSYQVMLDMELRLRSLKDNNIIWKHRFSGSLEDKYKNVYALAKGEKGKHPIAYLFSKILKENMDKIEPDLLKAICKNEGLSQ